MSSVFLVAERTATSKSRDLKFLELLRMMKRKLLICWNTAWLRLSLSMKTNTEEPLTRTADPRSKRLGIAGGRNSSNYSGKGSGMSASFERSYPFILALVAAIGFFLFVPRFPVSANAAPSLFSAMISLAAIAVGFLATAKSILLTIDKRQIIIQLKATGKYETLVDYIVFAILWSFALAAASAVCFIADLSTPAEWHHWVFTAWVFILVTAGGGCFRVI